MTWTHLVALSAIALATALTGCTKNQQTSDLQDPNSLALRPLTTQEALDDFKQLTNYFRAFYGPLEYKEARFQFSFESWVGETENEIRIATSDAQIFGAYAKFLARFQDGHVGIGFPTNSTGLTSTAVPIFITPVADTYLIASVGPDLKTTSFAIGDEVVSIDGQTPDQLLPLILKYRSFATPESNRHFIFKALNRDFFMTELRPQRNTVRIQVRKPSGQLLTEDFVWKVKPTTSSRFIEDLPVSLQVPSAEEMTDAAGGSLMAMSQPKPFFATEQVVKKYGFRTVTADAEYRKKYGLSDADKPNIFAALYKFEGKTVLLVRNYTYHHADFPNTTYLKAYKAILDQWEGLTDVLVLDQTHNGGGSYCEEFFRLFIQEQKDGFVQNLNVDRKWIVDLRYDWGSWVGGSTGRTDLNDLFEAMGSTVERAYDQGLTLTEPLPIIGGRSKVMPTDYTWKKPMLVLTDELAGSCGDAFPMLIKNNQVAKIFGQRTMGLGGNVEGFELTHSRTQLRLTRGLFTSNRDDQKYLPEYWIENNGVQPDYPYRLTVDDFRKGFVDYTEAFSKKAIEQIPAATN